MLFISNYIKGFLQAYIDLKGFRSFNFYYIKCEKNILYNMCKPYIDNIRTTKEGKYTKIEVAYLTAVTDDEFYKGYLNLIFFKFKVYISYYRKNRLNKEYYLNFTTTNKFLITNITKALKYLGIHYKLCFIPKMLPKSHRYRLRINRKADISKLVELSIIEKEKVERILT